MIPPFLERIDRYEVREELGRGSSGAVYRVFDPRHRVELALKLFSGARPDPSAVERFRREAAVLTRLPPHPNLIRVHETGEHSGLPFYVMDLVRGRTLEALLRERAPLPWRETCVLVAKVARALGHLHDSSVVHRDVKPANVLVDDRTGEPWLGDLSLALDSIRETRLTQTGQLVGTPRYMAPEQLRGEGAGPLCDVFALGAVAYEALRGEPPSSPPEPIASVPAPVSAAVLRALAPDPATRSPSAAAFACELEAAAMTAAPPPARPGAPGLAELRGALGSGTSLVGATIGRYEVLSVLGVGGAGIVLRARSPERGEVAIKRLRRAPEAGRLARFERERRLLALVGEERGFVPLLEAVDTPGGPLIVMPLLGGGTLRDRIRHGPLPVDEAVRLLATLARALGRAHARGVVHRDFKPENVLFTEAGEPQIADLGLAKHFDLDAPGAEESVRLSRDGVFRGTPGYTPPEQMKDAAVAGPPADVFALGAVLYECLAGQQAFTGDNILAALAAAGAGDFEPLSSVRPEVPGWLSTIVDRALEVEPGDRFPDGSAFADALEAPGGASRSRGVIVAAAAVTAVALLVVVAGTGGATNVAPGVVASVASTTGTATSPPPRTASLPPASVPVYCEPQRRTRTLELRAVWGSYSWAHEKAARYVTYLPDGKRAVSAAADATIRTWDARTGVELEVVVAPLTTFALALPEARFGFGTTREGSVQLIDLLQQRPTRRLDKLPGVAALAVSPDGRTGVVTTDDPLLHSWDLARGTALHAKLPARVRAVAFTAPGVLLAAGEDRPRSIEIGGAVRATGAPWAVRRLAATPSGLVLAAGDDRALRLLDPETALVVREVGVAPAEVLSLAVSPDGKRALVGMETALSLWDLSGEGELRSMPSNGGVNSVAFSPDGRRALTAGDDMAIGCIDLDTWRDVGRPAVHHHGHVVGIVPGDGTVMTAGIDGAIRVWSIELGAVTKRLEGHQGRVSNLVAAGPSGAVSGSWDQTVRHWGASPPRELALPEQPPHGKLYGLGASPDGRFAATGTGDGRIVVWDLVTPTEIASLGPDQTWITGLAFVDATRFVAAGNDGSLKLWAVKDAPGEPGRTVALEALVSPVTGAPAATHVAASPDGAHVLVLDMFRIRLIDLSGHDVWKRELPEVKESQRAAFSADGHEVAACTDRIVRLLDAADGREVDRIDFAPTRDSPMSVAYTRDGRSLLVGTRRGMVFWFERKKH